MVTIELMTGSLAEDGDPALASPVVGRTVYRIVREALTNTRKHAPGAHVLVQIGYRESQVRSSSATGRPHQARTAS